MKERTLSWIVRGVLLAIILALAAFLYSYGKEHIIYIDNRKVTVGDTTYPAIEWGEYSVDGGEIYETAPNLRDRATVMRQKHTIDFLWEDEDYNEHSATVEFSVPLNEYEVVVSLPLLAAGLGPEDYIQEFVPMAQQLGLSQAEEENPEDMMADDGMGFDDISMDF